MGNYATSNTLREHLPGIERAISKGNFIKLSQENMVTIIININMIILVKSIRDKNKILYTVELVNGEEYSCSKSEFDYLQGLIINKW